MGDVSDQTTTDDPLRPDAVIDPGRSVDVRRLLGEATSMFPQMIKLIWRLLRDPRVPVRTKIAVAAAAGYLVSPVDLIPEFIPVVGLADDLLLIALVIRHMVETAGEEVVLEHWDGSRDLLEVVRSILDVASDFVPPGIRRLVGRLTGA